MLVGSDALDHWINESLINHSEVGLVSKTPQTLKILATVYLSLTALLLYFNLPFLFFLYYSDSNYYE